MDEGLENPVGMGWPRICRGTGIPSPVLTLICGCGIDQIPSPCGNGSLGALRGPQDPPDLSPHRVPPQLQAQKLRLAHSRGPFYSGSLPNVNQIGTGVPEFQVSSGHGRTQNPFSTARPRWGAEPSLSPQGPSPLDSTRSTRHHGLVERVQRDPRRMMSPLRRYVRQISFVPCPPRCPHAPALPQGFGSPPSSGVALNAPPHRQLSLRTHLPVTAA